MAPPPKRPTPLPAPSTMTAPAATDALKTLLRQRIAANGPLTVAEYMAECLLHPDHGYYARQDPFGAQGDFITAPEISQMFGELVGLCLAQAWMDQGGGAFVLAELGPGRGTLMADLLRACGQVPGFLDAAEIHLVEASPHLRARQGETLAGFAPHWHDTVEGLPEGPLFLIANEFFDALPIRQFTRSGTGWREHLVSAQGEALGLALGPALPYGGLESRLSDTSDGIVVETCAPAQPIMGEIAKRISRFGGAALIIDYGGWGSRGDTLQALRAHEMVDPFAEPGNADLTAHVDFQALAMAAQDVAVSDLTPQGVFLEHLGITARAQALAKGLSGPALTHHVAAHRRLTHPAEMGTLFQVLGLRPQGAPALPGLTT